jgi:hypothetical protein
MIFRDHFRRICPPWLETWSLELPSPHSHTASDWQLERQSGTIRCVLRTDLEGLLHPRTPPDLSFKRLIEMLAAAGWPSRTAHPSRACSRTGIANSPPSNNGWPSGNRTSTRHRTSRARSNGSPVGTH